MRNLRKKNALWMSSLIPLLFSMAVVQVRAPPAIGIYVDPESYRAPNIGATFTINVNANVIDPPGPGVGLVGFEYKLKWDDSILRVVSIQYHVPSGWTDPFEVANATLDLDGDGVTDGHSLALTTLAGTPFTGTMSLCTYTFRVKGLGDCALNLYEDILVDDTATEISHETVDGEFATLAQPFPIVNIVIIILIALFFVLALYYVKKRILK